MRNLPKLLLKRKLINYLKFRLHGNKQKFLGKAFLTREKAKQNIAKDTFSEEKIKKVDNNFFSLIEEYLNEQQYSKFKTIMKDYL